MPDPEVLAFAAHEGRVPVRLRAVIPFAASSHSHVSSPNVRTSFGFGVYVPPPVGAQNEYVL